MKRLWQKYPLVITVIGMLIGAMLYFLTCFIIHSVKYKPKEGDIVILGEKPGSINFVKSENVDTINIKIGDVLKVNELDKDWHEAVNNQIRLNDPFMDAYMANDIKKMRVYCDSMRYYSNKAKNILKLKESRGLYYDTIHNSLGFDNDSGYITVIGTVRGIKLN